MKSEIGVESIPLRCKLGDWRARPIDFKNWTRYIGDAQSRFFQKLSSLSDLLCVELQEILVPHTPEFDPFKAKFLRNHLHYVSEVLADLVINDGDSERRVHILNPSCD